VQVYVGSDEKCSVKLDKHVEVMNAAGMKAASASVLYQKSANAVLQLLKYVRVYVVISAL